MKNLSEYALCFTTQNWLILHSKDINSGNIISEGDQKIINNCHIYMIHTRPLISFVKILFCIIPIQNIWKEKLKLIF